MIGRLVGLALLSGGLLIAEIAFTRLFSALYYPPFVFAVLSLAVLGIGLGAGIASWHVRLRNTRHTAIYTAFASLSVLGVFAVAAGPAAVHNLLLPLVPLPFLGAGLYLATVFSNSSQRSSLLYLADLVGAGMGAGLAVPLFNQIGVVYGVLSGALAIAAAGVLSVYPRRARFPWLAIVLLIGAVMLQQRTGWLSLNMASLPTAKPMVNRIQNGGRVVHSVWNAMAHTDLVDPGNGLPYELYMDGAAGSIMPPAGGHDALWRDIGFFPFATEQPQRAFVIGPGGGLDIWFGLQSNVSELVAVEVNPASVDLSNLYSAYNGNLFGQPEVRVVIDEGRSVLQREEQTYDLIFLSQVVTLAADRDGYVLVENSAYTREAFSTYLEHLSPQGQIALKLYDEPTLIRAFATAVAALAQRAQLDDARETTGAADSRYLDHIIALLDPTVEPPIPLLLVRNSPYSRADALSIGAVADRVGFRPLFLPGVWAEPPLDAVQSGSRAFADVIAEAGADFRPTTDDWPFFFQLERGLPRNLWAVVWSLTAVVVAGAFALVTVHRKTEPAGFGHGWPVYFAALGLGFMLVEVGIMQQTRLFLGHPTYAIAVVLAALLIYGGLGSFLARGTLRSGRRQHAPLWPLAAILLYLPLWNWGWPWLAHSLFAANLPWRLLAVIVAIAPVGLLLGIPFPRGLRAIGAGAADAAVALAWTVNGVMSVAGAVLAVVIALLAGYTAVLAAAWLCYAVALGAAIIMLTRFEDGETERTSLQTAQKRRI